jgi:putative flippase GtrA
MEPWCDDPASYYKTADCFLITSDYEGYGMTIVEALAAGCPVVSTDVGIAKEAGASIGTDAAKLGALLLQTLIGYGRNKLPETFLVDKQRYLETMKLSWKELEAGEVSSWCHVFGIFFRFFVTGCTGAVINLGSLYSLTRWAHLWYVTATCLAFLFAFLVTFFLQKHWTFRVKEAGDTGKQMLQYVIVAGINLVLNVIIIYALVEWVAPYTVKSWLYGPALYTAAAFISNGFIAIESFVVYRIFIFKKK